MPVLLMFCTVYMDIGCANIWFKIFRRSDVHNKTLFLRLSKSKISLIGKRMDKIYFAQNCIRPAKDLIDKRLEFKNLENQLTHEKVVCFCPMIDTLKTDLFSLDIMKNFYYSILIRNHRNLFL